MTLEAPAPLHSSVAIPALDGFRAIAITLVMASHIGLQRWFPGQFGVTLFFFLSGYLITTLLRREYDRDQRIAFKAFYLRRAVRILPPMVLTIMLVAALSLVGLIHPLRYPGLITDFLFLSNYLPLSGIPIGLWSLAVEEHYYLLFPALLAALAAGKSWPRAALVLALLCGGGLLVRLWEVARLDDFAGVSLWSHTRLDSILFGSVLALWNNPVFPDRDRLPKGWAGYLLAAVILLPTFAIRDEVFRQTYRYSIQGIGLIVLFNTAIRDRRWAPLFLDNVAMRFVALLSYSLYLVHGALVELCAPLAAFIGPITAGALGLALSFSFALMMNRWVERPLAHWRKGIEAAIRDRSGTRQAPNEAQSANP